MESYAGRKPALDAGPERAASFKEWMDEDEDALIENSKVAEKPDA